MIDPRLLYPDEFCIIVRRLLLLAAGIDGCSCSSQIEFGDVLDVDRENELIVDTKYDVFHANIDNPELAYFIGLEIRYAAHLDDPLQTGALPLALHLDREACGEYADLIVYREVLLGGLLRLRDRAFEAELVNQITVGQENVVAENGVATGLTPDFGLLERSKELELQNLVDFYQQVCGGRHVADFDVELLFGGGTALFLALFLVALLFLWAGLLPEKAAE